MGSKTKIDWCDSSWNPVTGCLHECEYCYARGIAERFAGFAPEENGNWNTIQYRKNGPRIAVLNGMQARRQKDGKVVPAIYPFGFMPTLHRYRLDDPQHWKKPRTIFVCSMADLFGEWVPDEWIREVFKACEDAPQHRYLFLTKNPQRYNDLMAARKLPEHRNFWYGGTRTGIDTAREHEAAMTANTFLSIEPLLAPMEPAVLNAIEMWRWVIVGAETGNRKNKIVPEKKWVDDIAATCREAGVPLFMKESLRHIMGDDFMQKFPWEARQ